MGNFDLLVRWNLVYKVQIDGGLGFGGFKIRIMALVANLGWSFIKHQDSFWCLVFKSFHGSKVWNQVNFFAAFSLGIGSRILFGIILGFFFFFFKIPLKFQFLSLFIILEFPFLLLTECGSLLSMPFGSLV